MQASLDPLFQWLSGILYEYKMATFPFPVYIGLESAGQQTSGRSLERREKTAEIFLRAGPRRGGRRAES